MATANDLPAALRGFAGRIPADALDRMPAAELRHRVGYAADLERRAPGTGEGRILRDHATRILRAMPLRDLIEQRRQLHEAARAFSGGLDSPAHELSARSAKLKEDHHYPPGLLAAAERVMLGRSANYPADVGAILGFAPDPNAPVADLSKETR